MKLSCRNQGLSLIELLVTITIIGGLIAFIFSRIGIGDPSPQVSRLNAKNAMTLHASAVAYGVTFESQTPEGIISELIAGVKSPNYEGGSFQLPLDPDKIGDCAKYLQFKEDRLWWKPERRQ